METGSSSHPTEHQVCYAAPSPRISPNSQLNHEGAAQAVSNDASSAFRGTPGEESGGHLPVGAEALPPETSNQPGEPASLPWCQYAGSPVAKGI